MLFNLHALRVIAALGVVYFHTTSEAGLKLDSAVGSRCVDLFFVISGFIIAYIGTTKPDAFLRRRLIRVAPFYWAATLTVCAIAAVAPQVLHNTTADVPHLLASMLFVPHEAEPNGMMPTLLLGWSLNLEIFFYLWFALSLKLSPKRAPLVCAGCILGVVLAVHVAGVNGGILGFYGRPIVLEFCFGIGAYYLFDWCVARKERLARSAAFKWTLVVILAVSLVALDGVTKRFGETIPRWLASGVPAFLIVMCALLLERIYGMAIKNRLVHLLGESSYIIYLAHPYVVFTVLRVLVKGRALSWPATVLLIAGLLALTSAVAAAVHLWFEKPVMAFLRAKLTDKKTKKTRAHPTPRLSKLTCSTQYPSYV